jgi:hypothetical protein
MSPGTAGAATPKPAGPGAAAGAGSNAGTGSDAGTGTADPGFTPKAAVPGNDAPTATAVSGGTGNTQTTVRPPSTPPPVAPRGAGDGSEGMDKPEKMTGAGSAAAPVNADPWQAIEDLRAVDADPALAIYKMEDYRRTDPGKHDAEIERYMDEKFDRLWWERIDGLFKRINRLNAEMTNKKRELWDENNPEEKKKKMAEITQATKDVEQANKVLRDTMGYEKDQPPPLTDKAALASLAQTRDAAKYALWKKLTLNSIRDKHGSPPWAGEQ